MKQKKDGECTISRTTMEEFSWEMIKAALNRNEVRYQIGDVVTSKLRNGNPQEWVITDIGKDYIRFEARDCIKDAEQRMNKEWTNAGGIALSEMQGYLDNDIWNLLPSDLQEVIATVDRKYMDGDEEKIYRTKLFLPSASEVFDKNNCFGEENLYEQLNYYRDQTSQSKVEWIWWWFSALVAFVSVLRRRYGLLLCDYRGCGQRQRREQLGWRGPLLPNRFIRIIIIWRACPA